MNHSPHSRKSNVFRPFGLAVALAAVLVCLNVFIVRSQNPSPTVTGRTFAFVDFNTGELGAVVRYTRTSAAGDVRIVFGRFDNQNNAPDAAIVEGDSITTILDVGPARPSSVNPDEFSNRQVCSQTNANQPPLG